MSPWPPPRPRPTRFVPPRRARRRSPVLLWLILAAALAGLAYAVWPTGLGGSGRSTGSDQALEAQLIATRRQVARLQGQVDALETRLQVMEARSGYQSPLAEPPPVPDPR